MENSPFGSNAESDDSNQWEVSDADLQAEKDDETKEKPKRNLFETAKERDKREKAESDKKKPSLFEALLGKNEIDDEENKKEKVENNFLQPVETVEAEEAEPLVEASPATDTAAAEQFEEIVDDKIESVDQEIVGSGEPTKVSELLADAELLETVAEKLDEGQDPVRAIENATDEMLENPLPDATETEIPDFVEGVLEIEHEDNEPQVATTTPTTPPVRPTPPPPPPRNQPPTPPATPPVVPPLPPSATPSPFGGPPVMQNFNLNVPPITPNTAPIDNPDLVPMNDSFNRDPRTGRVLASGLLGYMIGRRGGRKRTEAKLKPVISKQEKQLEDLNAQLETSEELVRKTAAAEAEASAKKTQLEAEAASRKADIREAVPVELPAETIADERKEFEERERKLEAALDAEEKEKKLEKESVARAGELETQEAEEVLHILEKEREKEAVAMTAAVEKLQLSNRAETEEEKRQEKAKATAQVEETRQEKARLSETKRGFDARRMTLPRVLEVAEFIPLKNSMNLRQMYEAKRIDAVNLRRIVNEYMNGGNYERALEQSLEAVEIRSELKHEIKQDNSIYTQPGQTAHSVVDGLIAATKVLESTDAKAPTLSAAATQTQKQSQETNQDDDTSMVVSNSVAITIGIAAGILITILLLLYSSQA